MLVRSISPAFARTRPPLVALLMLALLAALLLPLLLRQSGPRAHWGTDAWGMLPLSFEPNAGQVDPSVHYLVRQPGGLALFSPTGVTLLLAAPAVPRTVAGA